MRRSVTAEQQAVLDAIQRTITLLGDADLSMVRERWGSEA